MDHLEKLHSRDPPKLFNKEFGDINNQILGSGADKDGGSAVFFGYGFSGSGKTYTLMDKNAPGFLKTIVSAQIGKGNKNKSVYVKELYPYFPYDIWNSQNSWWNRFR